MPTDSTRILVVDDNPAGRYATSHVLRSAGFTILEAATGGEALDKVTSGVELVVLDVNLPDIDGFEVCRRIRDNAALARIPVIHLSATFVKDVDKVHGLEMGADGYLVKAADELGPALAAALASGRPSLIQVPMENAPTPTPGHWDINDIYRKGE